MSREEYDLLAYGDFHAQLDQAASQDPLWETIREKLDQETNPMRVPDYETFFRICQETLHEQGMLSDGAESWNQGTYARFASSQTAPLIPSSEYLDIEMSEFKQFNLPDFIFYHLDAGHIGEADHPERDGWGDWAMPAWAHAMGYGHLRITNFSLDRSLTDAERLQKIRQEIYTKRMNLRLDYSECRRYLPELEKVVELIAGKMGVVYQALPPREVPHYDLALSVSQLAKIQKGGTVWGVDKKDKGIFEVRLNAQAVSDLLQANGLSPDQLSADSEEVVYLKISRDAFGSVRQVPTISSADKPLPKPLLELKSKSRGILLTDYQQPMTEPSQLPALVQYLPQVQEALFVLGMLISPMASANRGGASHALIQGMNRGYQTTGFVPPKNMLNPLYPETFPKPLPAPSTLPQPSSLPPALPSGSRAPQQIHPLVMQGSGSTNGGASGLQTNPSASKVVIPSTSSVPPPLPGRRPGTLSPLYDYGVGSTVSPYNLPVVPFSLFPYAPSALMYGGGMEANILPGFDEGQEMDLPAAIRELVMQTPGLFTDDYDLPGHPAREVGDQGPIGDQPVVTEEMIIDEIRNDPELNREFTRLWMEWNQYNQENNFTKASQVYAELVDLLETAKARTTRKEGMVMAGDSLEGLLSQQGKTKSGIQFKINGGQVIVYPPGAETEISVGGFGITDRSVVKMDEEAPGLSELFNNAQGHVIFVGNGFSDYPLSLAERYKQGEISHQPIIVELYDYRLVLEDFTNLRRAFEKGGFEFPSELEGPYQTVKRIVDAMDAGLITSFTYSMDLLKQALEASNSFTYQGITYKKPKDILGDHPEYEPVQRDISVARLRQYAEAMEAGRWDWENMQAPNVDGELIDDPIGILTTPSGRKIIGNGHHRYFAAQLTGTPIPESAIHDKTTGDEPKSLSWDQVDWLWVDPHGVYPILTPPYTKGPDTSPPLRTTETEKGDTVIHGVTKVDHGKSGGDPDEVYIDFAQQPGVAVSAVLKRVLQADKTYRVTREADGRVKFEEVFGNAPPREGEMRAEMSGGLFGFGKSWQWQRFNKGQWVPIEISPEEAPLAGMEKTPDVLAKEPITFSEVLMKSVGRFYSFDWSSRDGVAVYFGIASERLKTEAKIIANRPLVVDMFIHKGDLETADLIQLHTWCREIIKDYPNLGGFKIVVMDRRDYSTEVLTDFTNPDYQPGAEPRRIEEEEPPPRWLTTPPPPKPDAILPIPRLRPLALGHSAATLMAKGERLIASWEADPANYTPENIQAARDALTKAQDLFVQAGDVENAARAEGLLNQLK